MVDVRATTAAPWAPNRSLPGTVRLQAGGSARNVAVNLVRLGHCVVLLTALGDDPLGRWLTEITAGTGVDLNHAVRRPQATGMFVTAGPETGDRWCIGDAGPVEVLLPADLDAWRRIVAGASVVVSDANLSERTQDALAAAAGPVPRVLLATSPAKAVRLRSVLDGAAVVVCTRDEAQALTALPDSTGWQALGEALLARGVGCAVVTEGPEGVGIVTRGTAVARPAPAVCVVDATGAGDAVAAVAVHAHLAGLDAAEAARLAVAAAACVVQSEDNTPAALARVVRG